MNVIILEDEIRAANHLERLLAKIAPEMRIVKKLDTVRNAVKFLQLNANVDLIFSDIQLADGLSFELFIQVSVNCPIIFTTAYDQYAIEAFKTNGIDYLLKPIEEERLNKAIEKVKKFNPSIDLEKIMTLVKRSETKTYKSRFMVKAGDKIKTIQIGEILAFYSMEKATFLYTTSNRSFYLEYSLDQLELLIDPDIYFKISRKYIVSFQACTNILVWSNSRLQLKIEGLSDRDIIVARERVSDFKKWLDR